MLILLCIFLVTYIVNDISVETLSSLLNMWFTIMSLPTSDDCFYTFINLNDSTGVTIILELKMNQCLSNVILQQNCVKKLYFKY